MPREKKRTKRIKYFIWGALIIPLLLYLISFWGDLSQVFAFFWQFLRWLARGGDQALPSPTGEAARSITVILFTCGLGYLGTFLIWLLLMSFQALLPVETLDEVLETASHQLLYITGGHGPAIFVHDGKIGHSSLVQDVKVDPASDELNRPGSGVIVVNFNSAIVLERLVGQRGGALTMLLDSLGRPNTMPISRVAGPGVVFSAFNERIRAIVDLRKQTRASKARISAYTRDGIEVGSFVFAVFTIGQRPDVIELAYQGDRRVENLRPISTRRVGKNLIEVKTQGDEELDPADRNEAHEYARIPNQKQDASKYKEVDRPRPEPEFDAMRVFNAVYAQARKPQDPQKPQEPQEQVEPWTELPVRVAADIYRSVMSGINYDELYDLQDPSPASYPLPRFKRRFRNQVRNLGMLWYRVVFHRSLIPLKDGTYNESDLFVSPYLPFSAHRLLRDRGIKVIFSGFSNPQPVSPTIYQQRLASWRAEWEHDAQKRRSSKDLDALRIRNHARALAQRNLTQSLIQIFARETGNEEVLALRVLQALEGVATDPKVQQQLTPGETISLMNSLHSWLLPGEINRESARALMPGATAPSAEAQDDFGDFDIGNDLPPDFVPPDNVPPPPTRGPAQSPPEKQP
jgi:hypothetical protein